MIYDDMSVPDVHLLDVKAGAWLYNRIPVLESGGRYHHSSCAVGTKIFVIGGI